MQILLQEQVQQLEQRLVLRMRIVHQLQVDMDIRFDKVDEELHKKVELAYLENISKLV